MTDSLFCLRFRLPVKSHMWIFYSTCNKALESFRVKFAGLAGLELVPVHWTAYWTMHPWKQQPACSWIIYTGFFFPCKYICFWPANHSAVSWFNHSNMSGMSSSGQSWTAERQSCCRLAAVLNFGAEISQLLKTPRRDFFQTFPVF